VFAHPLVGAAVVGDLPASRRQALHRAAGATVPGAAGMRHRLAGCAGHDAGLATEARAEARAEAARGGFATAARLWAEVARVAPEPADREHARLQAVDHHLLAGDVAAAARDRDDVERATDGPLRSFLQGRLAYVLGPRREADGHLDRAWRQVTGDDGTATDDVDLAGRIAALRATTAVDRADGPTGMVWARRALALAPVAAADCNHGHMLAMSCALVGEIRAGIDELSAALDPPPAGSAAVTDLHLGRGVLRLWAGDLGPAADDLASCLATWGGGGTFVARETARYFLAEVHYRAGRWDDAVVAAETAAALVDETDQAWLAAFPHAVAVLPLAARGEWARADSHLAAARTAAAVTRGGAAGLWAGLAALRLAEARQDPEAVVRAAEALGGLPAGRAVPRDEAIVPWRASFAEALAAVGRLDDAAAAVDWLAGDAAGSRHPLVQADLARARIAVATAAGEVARAAEEAGSALHPDAGPAGAGALARGRLELVAARAFLAAGAGDAASDALAAARARFEGLRAAPWVAAVDREHGPTGRPRRARRGAAAAGDVAELTPQEHAVAHVVARGATNREAADELFISIKTVEHHLSRVYAKLGVRSRTELAALLG
jgi:DNA-binding CsgD family transcriptional regulator